MIDYLKIIQQYYVPGSDAYRLLVQHSTQVADLAMELIDGFRGPIDRDFVYEAAMLHDIGMFKTNAPAIYCFGTQPYICHGILGRELLDSIAMPRHALVCERHTGAGLTAQEIIDQHLPLPAKDMLPVSYEEKVVCYADKFFSKSHICAAKPIAKVRSQLSQYGEGTLSRFDALTALFGVPQDAR